ncbi:MAG TPA: hypothetical protein VEZ46_07185 [Mycobacteriales bacterium]|nr:hypothetical protein [Mycobacteriales bacterium]
MGTHSVRSGRWRVALLAVAIVAEVSVAGGVLVAERRPPGVPRPVAAAPTPTPTRIRAAVEPTAAPEPTRGVAPRPAPPRSLEAARTQRVAAATTLLGRRATALRRRDRKGFAATLDSRQRSFYRSQLEMFDNLEAVGLASWSYRVDRRETRLPAKVVRRYAADEVFAPGVTLAYALDGADGHRNELEQKFTLVRRGTRWFVGSDTDLDVGSHRTARELWDFGPVLSVQGERTVVLGSPTRASYLRALASTTDAAIPRVSAVWGEDWSQQVVVLVPRSQEQVSDLLGERADLSQIAAVAVARVDIVDNRYRTVGNRVIVNPRNFDRLGRLGREVVMRHEVTHVATRGATGPNVPAWLIEGMADYIGYLGTGVSDHGAAAALRSDLRAGRPPRELPADKDFDGGNKRLSQAYEGSWLAARMIVDQTSQRTLVKFYRALGADRSATRAAAMANAMRSVLKTTPGSFTKAWRAYARAKLA